MRSIINEKNLNNKKILLRLDLNVPLEKDKITDTTRIDKILPTLNFLIKENAKIIILSHVGRPKGKIVKELSLEPIRKELQNKLGKKVKLITENIKEIKSKSLFNNFNNGEILILENIRFYSEEEQNDNKFAELLSNLGDIYVNEAFSCSHRAHASINKIPKFLPSFSGLQLDLEVNALNKIISEITKPITCIIGGSKISTKIGVIKNLIPKFNNIIIVGGMANNILNYKGNQIGNSIKEENCEKIIDEIFKTSKQHACSIIFPIDVQVGKNLDSISKAKELNEIEEDDLILDIGPKTISIIKKVIENSETVLWNGPAGYFENPNFANGSYEIANAIVKKNKNKSIYSVLGGGDTIALVNEIKLIKNFNFVSTAGGAFLEYLEGKELPGIKALK